MRSGMALALGLTLALSSPSSAEADAIIYAIEGRLAIRSGEGFVQVAASAEAAVGSEVMANPGGRGRSTGRSFQSTAPAIMSAIGCMWTIMLQRSLRCSLKLSQVRPTTSGARANVAISTSLKRSAT